MAAQLRMALPGEGSTKDFLDRLKAYIDRGTYLAITDRVVAMWLHQYLSEGFRANHIPDYRLSSGVGHYLPYYIQDAFNLLRISAKPKVAALRKEYESISGDDVPDLLDVSGGVSRTLAISGVSRLVRDVYEADPRIPRGGYDWLQDKIERYLQAQDQVLQQYVHQFAVRCWRMGLVQMLDESQYTGFSGSFGKTRMRSLSTAGRVMFTLARSNPLSQWIGNEDSVTIIGEDGDKTGLRMGIQSVHCDFRTACDLISDVVHHWPKSLDALKKVYRHDREVSLV